QQFVSAFLADSSCRFLASGADCIATAAGRLLVFCATMAPKSADRAWYWMKGIDLLDRLCDVGPSNGHSCPSPAQIEFAADMLDRPGPLSRLCVTTGATLRRMWRRATRAWTVAHFSDAQSREEPAVRKDGALPSPSAAPRPSGRLARP